jgi:transposase-like protein
MKCPRCSTTVKQNKIGKTSAGSQRWRCFVCQCKYTPEKKPRGYSPALQQQAIRLYVEGTNLRRIGRHLGIDHRTAGRWVKARAESLPESAPMPENVHTAEMDELFTFIEHKKTGFT